MKRIGLIGILVLLLLGVFITTAAADTEGTVVGGWLRLRSAASFDATIIKSYYTGTVVTITGTSGSWYAVDCPDGYSGYMYSSYIDTSGGSSYTAYVTSTNGYGVRLRTGPSKGYRILGVYAVGTTVTVLQEGTIWSRIQIGSTVGYMMSEFLTTSSGGTTPESGDMATIWSSNGYGVRLRSGPSTSYSIIGLYSVGTRVQVITRGTTWDYILVGSRTGYMMNEFLIYDDDDLSVATDITLTPESTSGMVGTYLDLTVDVDGTDLSDPAYTLEITDNSSMAEISGDQLYIYDTATVGAYIEITATTTDDDEDGDPLTDTCSIEVTAAEPMAQSFTFDESAATVSIASGDVQYKIGYTISGYYLTSPYFTLTVSSEGSSYVTTSIDESSEEIILTISGSIPDETVFTITGTTTSEDIGGSNLTDTVTITITSDVISLDSIVVSTDESSLRYDEITDITAMLYYSNGSYKSASTSEYTVSVTTGSAYASTTTDTTYVLVPNASGLIGVEDQTIVITATATEDSSVTDTVNVLLYGRNTPEPPTLTSATAADQSVTVTWTASTDDGGEALTGYNLYYSASETGTKTLYASGISTSATTYDVTGLTNGTEYWFWMTAVNGQGESDDYSDSVSATPAPTEPSIPQNLTVSDRGDGYVTLSWDEPADTGGTGISIDHYIAYVDGGSGTTITSPTTTVTFSGLTNAQTYTFTVLAYNDYYPTSNPSLAAEVDGNPVGTPGAPTLLSVSPGDGAITVTWEAPSDTNGSDITGYDIYCKAAADPDPSSATAIALGTATSYEITGLTNGTEYEVWIIANNGYYDSAESDRETATPHDAPDAPSSVSVSTESNGSVSITWAAPADNGGSDITGYAVYYSDGGAETLYSELDASTFTETISGLTNGVTYTFSVYADNAYGRSAAGTTTGTPSTIPGAPTDILSTGSSGSVLLSWIEPTDDGGSAITGYEVYYDDGGGASYFTTVSYTSATVTGLTNGTTYTFTVYAENANGISTTYAEVTGMPYTVTDAPASLTVTANSPSNGDAYLVWTAPSNDGGKDVTNYVIEYGFVMYAAMDVITVDATVLEYTISMTTGGDYWFEVYATNDNGANFSPPATQSSVTISNPD